MKKNNTHRHIKLTGFLEGLLMVIVVPLSLLNLLGGIISWIWLLFAGGWRLIILSLIAGFIAILLVSLLLTITYAISVPILQYAINHRKRALLSIGVLISSFLHSFIVYVVSSFLFLFIIGMGAGYPNVPVAMLAYSLAMAPWTYMAQGEWSNNRDSNGLDATTLTIFFLSLGLAFSLIAFLISGNATIVQPILALSMGLYIVTTFIVSLTMKLPSKLEMNEPSQDEHPHKTKVALKADELYDPVIQYIQKNRKISAAIIQYEFQVSYAVAITLLDRLEAENIVGPVDGAKPREIYI